MPYDCVALVQADIQASLRLRGPAILTSSAERPNLHLSCRAKPSDDVALMSGLIIDLILGKPCSLAPEPLQLAPPGHVPATVIYCVSKAEVETMRSVLDADVRLKGRVRRHAFGASLSQPGFFAAVHDVDGVRHGR